MEIQTSAQLAVKEAMSVTGCRTQEELAERVGVSQNAIWKLLNGKSKTAQYKTARAFEKATNGVVSRFRFLEEEQGTTEQESQDGSTDASSDDAQATACPRSTVSSASRQRTDTHGGDSPLVGG